MKKAVLLLAMVTVIAGCIYLKNADKDTVLFEQQVNTQTQYTAIPKAEYTEESISEEAFLDESIRETVSEEVVEEETTFSQEETPIYETGMEMPNITRVMFERLSQDEQKIYSEILASLLSQEEETILSTLDTTIIDKAFTCVMVDYPEFFYVDGYKYTEYTRDNKVEKIVFTGKYTYDKEEIKRRQELIDSKVAEILAGMPDSADEYVKVKYFYDVLVTGTEYDIHSVDNQNICSVFMNGKSVCQGYAKALQYLMNRAGMECCLVLGNVIGGEGHAWNLVSVNGSWYHVDATWGDAFYLFGNQQQVEEVKSSVINYDYLCVTTKQILMTHQPDMPVELPECVSMADNYFVREGLYFTEYDGERLAGVFEQAVARGQETLTVKCSDREVYDTMHRILLDEQKIFEFINSTGTIAYTDNPEQGIMTFWLFEGRY